MRRRPLWIPWIALAAAGALGLTWAAAPPHATPPAAVPRPELVGEGVLSTPDDEQGAAFSADGRTAYFTLRSPTTNTTPLTALCVSHQARGRWTTPEVLPFSGRFNDASPALSPDGAHLVFASDRPAKRTASTSSAPRSSAGVTENRRGWGARSTGRDG